MGLWIVKPCASSCGRGIKVITSQQAEKLNPKKKAVIQRYLMKPYLIDGKKFDLRIYVLVTGVDPLRVYIHDEGLTRISTASFSLKNISNQFAHLTNYSINKKAGVFKAAAVNDDNLQQNNGDIPTQQPSNAKGNDQAAETEGFKWSLNAFRRWLAKKEGTKVMEATFDKIFDLCLKTMIAAESEITPHLHQAANYRTNCFELFGCDVILDSSLTPHLLEVNVSPSLMGSSPLDKKIKGTVIADIFHIVGFYPHDHTLLKRYSRPQSASHLTGSDGSAGESLGSDSSNPFAYSSLSKMMSSQEVYRRDPSSVNVDLSSLGNNESCWLLLLMVEDELARAESSQFHVVHPTANTAAYYTTLYRNCRFSDHLLAKWIQGGGSNGEYRQYIPRRFLGREMSSSSKSTINNGCNVKQAKSAEEQDNKRNVATAAPKSAGSRPRPLSAGRAVSSRMTKQQPLNPTPPSSLNSIQQPQLEQQQQQQQQWKADLTSTLVDSTMLEEQQCSSKYQNLSIENDLNEATNRNSSALTAAERMRLYHVESLPNYYLERINPLGYKPEYASSSSEKAGPYQLFLNPSDQAYKSSPLTPPSNVGNMSPPKGDIAAFTTGMLLDLVNSKHTTPRRSRPVEERRAQTDALAERKTSAHRADKKMQPSLAIYDLVANSPDAIPDDIFTTAKYTYASSPQSSSKFNPFTPRHRAELPFENSTNVLRNEMMQLTAGSGGTPSSRNNNSLKKSTLQNNLALATIMGGDPLLQRGALALLNSNIKKDGKRLEQPSSSLLAPPMTEEDMLDILRRAVNYTESQNIVSETAVSTREWMRSIVTNTISQPVVQPRTPQQNNHHHPRSKSNPAPDRSLPPTR
eukprot:CAMPEP_0170104660 /NCGR_PEP_ID=MMETSP0020_2-20130122/4274_1 /TAXON_ID=98059 /ORGANISM="Dinobryon sp., Strain UTEXLB2267" /LENGTH=857 /DNA_ID=CAMNT_0010328565 /DNA_START=495 /DNA_END=3068 /DNA_ORIENTATION=+